MYECAKIQRKILLENALAMIFLKFILVCYVTHTAKYLTNLLTLRHVLKFDNLHDSVCEDNRWIHDK